MGKTIIVNTGGTIAMAADPVSGSVKQQDEQPLQRLLPRLQQTAKIEMDDFLHIPSPHMTPQLMLDLARRVERHLDNNDVSGVVVTHGTDTLEETAYFLDLAVDSPKPVIVTGAMRSSNELGADGPLNLAQSVIVATDSASAGRGTLVVFNGEIHSARSVSKVHTSSAAAFASETGPIGAIARDKTHYWSAPLPKRERYAVEKLNANVPLIKATTDMQKEWLSFILDDRIDGVVIEAFGIGNVPPAIVPTVREALRQQKPVVLVSRCPHGLVQPIYDYEGGGAQLKQMGVLFAAGLSGPKARLKLMLALDSGRPFEDLAELF